MESVTPAKVRDHTYPPRRKEIAVRQLARRLEVVGLMRQGYSMREVARQLGVSPGTVCADWQAILAELNAEERALEQEWHDLLTRAARLMARAAEVHRELCRRRGEPVAELAEGEGAAPGVAYWLARVGEGGMPAE